MCGEPEGGRALRNNVEAAREMNQSQVVLRLFLPADQQLAKADG